MTPEAGDIAWASVSDARGSRKIRPVVVLNASDRIDGVAVTTSPIDPSNPQNVPLPFHPAGNVSTRLKKQCWAACDWIVTFDHADVIEIRGHVPSQILLEIRQRALRA